MPNKLYDWDGWFAKSRFVLIQHVDYECGQAAMVQQIRSAASHRNVGIAVAEGDGEIAVVITHRGEVEAAASN